MVLILPTVDSADYELPPAVVAALIAQLPASAPAPAPSIVTDPDGTPVLVIGA